MEKQMPKVDVIIPVYRPDEKFDRLMEKLGQQTLAPNHIYVMHTIPDGQGEDTLLPACADLEKVTVVPVAQTEFNHGGTRNQGVQMAEGEFVLLMTQDAVPEDGNLIARLVEQFQNPNVSAAYARQLATKEVGIIEAYTRQFNYPDQDCVKSLKDLKKMGIKTYFCSDVCAMYRKDIYEKMGGFVTKTIFNEDMILASNMIQAGYAVAYASKARVYHAHKYSAKQQFQRNFDLGVSHREYREIFEGLKSESEGIKMIKQTAVYLLRQGRPFQIIKLVWHSGWKFIGYRLGKRYDRLPMCIVRMASSQKSYWK